MNVLRFQKVRIYNKNLFKEKFRSQHSNVEPQSMVHYLWKYCTMDETTFTSNHVSNVTQMFDPKSWKQTSKTKPTNNNQYLDKINLLVKSLLHCNGLNCIPLHIADKTMSNMENFPYFSAMKQINSETFDPEYYPFYISIDFIGPVHPFIY